MQRYKVLIGMTFPADQASLDLVTAAGGFGGLSPEQAAEVRLRRAEAGEILEWVPDVSLPALLAQGALELVVEAPVDAEAVAARARSRRGGH